MKQCHIGNVMIYTIASQSRINNSCSLIDFVSSVFMQVRRVILSDCISMRKTCDETRYTRVYMKHENILQSVRVHNSNHITLAVLPYLGCKGGR